ILGGAERFDEVRVVQDWSYESDLFSARRFFLCGDSACFTDPLFSQGVHLAAQSAVCAASDITRMQRQPEENAALHLWYNRSYRETYEQYHEFLASFYTFASFTEPDSEFWRKRRIAESDDERLDRRQWFERLGERAQRNDFSVADFRDRASTMIAIGRHPRLELSDTFSEAELNPARLRWISDLTKQLNAIKRLEWEGREVRLEPYYKVDPATFELELKTVLANEHGRRVTKYAVGPAEHQIFARLAEMPIGYREAIEQLSEAGRRESSSQIIIRLLEAGLLNAYDKNGARVTIQDRLRFDGVGEEYEV
ncbi:MAG TPA: tryptophan 7-halogenase, partial [Polyangiaceae bacterium]|nr:tryptophan 7-halogenase [Polyangiaceae bacterium]